MKVDLQWGAKTTSARFTVNAANLESALKILNGRGEWGLFQGSFTYKWVGDGQQNVTLVRLSPTFTITMPSWPSYKDQPQACKDEWDAMWRALLSHEDGHRAIFEQAISRLVKKIEELQAAKGGEIDQMIAQARDQIQSEHDSFDTSTDHGRSRGVELNITEQCRSKRN